MGKQVAEVLIIEVVDVLEVLAQCTLGCDELTPEQADALETYIVHLQRQLADAAALDRQWRERVAGLEAALAEARTELAVIASYADDPETSAGLRSTARAYRRCIARIDALAPKEPT